MDKTIVDNMRRKLCYPQTSSGVISVFFPFCSFFYQSFLFYQSSNNCYTGREDFSYAFYMYIFGDRKKAHWKEAHRKKAHMYISAGEKAHSERSALG